MPSQDYSMLVGYTGRSQLYHSSDIILILLCTLKTLEQVAYPWIKYKLS